MSHAVYALEDYSTNISYVIGTNVKVAQTISWVLIR
jgi:hypothetical protein